MNKQDLLYHYFSNSLTTEQEKLFYSLLETDADFKAEFDFHKNLKQVIKSHESDTLKTKLQGFESAINTETNTPKKSVFNYSNFAIAASVAILVGWFGYNSFFGTNYNSLYDSNFNEYPNTVYTITRGDTDNSLEREAFVAYESKNYQTAIDKFDAIDDKKHYFNFYKAQAYLGLDNTDKAQILFNQVIRNNVQFVAESTWYSALIALKEKDKEQAIKLLQDLVNNYDFNKDKALTLLDTLK